MSDNSKPSTSTNRKAKLLKPLHKVRADDLESDDDTVLSVRQSKESVVDVRPTAAYKTKKRADKVTKGRVQKQQAEDSEDEEINVIDSYECLNFIDLLKTKGEMDMVTRDREERRKYRNDLSLATSMNRALLLENELRNRFDNSDDEEIDVVTLPSKTTNDKQQKAHQLFHANLVRKLKKQRFPLSFQNLDNDQHSNLVSYRTRKAVRNQQNEEEEIDVVNVAPNDIPSSSVAIFNFSNESSVYCRRSYSLRKRLHTCNYNYALAMTSSSSSPPVTIDLLDSTIDERTDSVPPVTDDDSDTNIDVIDITDTSINSDIIIVEDTADESTPCKSMPRRVGLGDCPVCLEDFTNKEIMSTICGHVFCAPCIKGVIRANKKCPNCRKHLTLKSIHPLFI